MAKIRNMSYNILNRCSFLRSQQKEDEPDSKNDNELSLSNDNKLSFFESSRRFVSDWCARNNEVQRSTEDEMQAALPSFNLSRDQSPDSTTERLKSVKTAVKSFKQKLFSCVGINSTTENPPEEEKIEIENENETKTEDDETSSFSKKITKILHGMNSKPNLTALKKEMDMQGSYKNFLPKENGADASKANVARPNFIILSQIISPYLRNLSEPRDES